MASAGSQSSVRGTASNSIDVDGPVGGTVNGIGAHMLSFIALLETS